MAAGDGLVAGGVFGRHRLDRPLAARVERIVVLLERLDPLTIEDVLDPLLEAADQAEQPGRFPFHVALGVERDAPAALQAINRAVGAPAGLAALGMPREGIARAVELALANPYWNPRALTRDGLTQLVSDAFHGAAPRAYG